MAKRIIFTVLQFIAFFVLLCIGGYWDAISLPFALAKMQGHPVFILSSIPFITFPMGSHTLVADGILFATVLLVVLLAIQATRKKLKPAAFYTLGAFVVAVILSLLFKVGLPPAN